jgi:hypothetical protein
MAKRAPGPIRQRYWHQSSGVRLASGSDVSGENFTVTGFKRGNGEIDDLFGSLVDFF